MGIWFLIMIDEGVANIIFSGDNVLAIDKTPSPFQHCYKTHFKSWWKWFAKANRLRCNKYKWIKQPYTCQPAKIDVIGRLFEELGE